MNKIIAIDHFDTQNWILNTEAIGPYYNDLFIGFTNEVPIVSFKNLTFGFELKQGDNIKKYGIYPPFGAKYIQTDQEYLVTERLDTKPDQTYQLFLWAENNSTRIEKEFEFTIPRPDAPFASWIWDAELLTWNAPAPYPEDDNVYTWDEDEQNWVEIPEAIYTAA